MKNENKFFDGDKIYEMVLTMFAGICAIGALVTVAVENMF